MSTGENILTHRIAEQLERIADALEERNRILDDALPPLDVTLRALELLIAGVNGGPAFDEWRAIGFRWFGRQAHSTVFPPDGAEPGPESEADAATSAPSQDSLSLTQDSGPAFSSSPTPQEPR